ncbi:MAG: penicillin-binding protein [Bacteriovoracia bacterium]
MKRIRLLKIFFVLFAAILAARATWLASGQDKRLAKLATRQFQSKETILPRRGLIFDRNGEFLAMSLKSKSLFLRPHVFKKTASKHIQKQVVETLAQILRVSTSSLRKDFESSKNFVWIKRLLSEEEKNAILQHGLLEFADGLEFAEESKRVYPNKAVAAHVLGTVNVDSHGIEGLEFAYENLLSGQKTKISSTKDAMGRRIFEDDDGVVAFKDGQSLVLTIDRAIQYEAEKVLTEALTNFQATSGTVIVANAKNGEILALANSPTFDPNNPKKSSADQRRNRAITDVFEPGSTFKPFIIGFALENGLKPSTKIYCEKGRFKVANRIISEAETHEKFEWLSLQEILKLSSNIGAAKIALDLSPQYLGSEMTKLGVGQKTGIDLPGEVSGLFRKRSLYNDVRRANVGFGQGFGVTAIQLLSYYVALANNGTWVPPRIVKAVLSEDPESLQNGAVRYTLGHKFEPVEKKQVLTSLTTKRITEMLQTVVQAGGTGVQAALDDWSVAGKTGTAQKIDRQTRRYSHENYIASFVGFAPVKNPSVVTLVIIDEPKKKIYASDTAAPVFRQITNVALIREKVSATEKREFIEPQPAMISAIDKSKVAKPVVPLSSETTTVPDLKGLTLRESIQTLGPLLEKYSIDLEISGTGYVTDQTPKPEQPLAVGAHLRLILNEK